MTSLYTITAVLHLSLRGDHSVGKLPPMGRPTRSTQPSIPLGRQTSSQPCNKIILQAMATFGCTVAEARVGMWAWAAA